MYLTFDSITFKEVNSIYTSVDGIIQVEFFVKGIRYNKIRIPYEYATTIADETKVKMTVNMPNPRIYDMSKYHRQRYVEDFLRQIGFDNITLVVNNYEQLVPENKNGVRVTNPNYKP